LGRNITPETHEIIATDLANLDECKFFYWFSTRGVKEITC
jgi:hypothetical protein